MDIDYTSLIEKVKKYPEYISYIDEPLESVQLAAITTDPYSIKYINNPTALVKTTALKMNFYCLHYISKENRSEEDLRIVIETCSNNVFQILDVNELNKSLRLYAIQHLSNAIRYIDKPSNDEIFLHQMIHG